MLIKMLFYDDTEARRGSKLPQECIEYGHLWRGIEAQTGGDFVVTPTLSPRHKIVLMKRKGVPIPTIAQRVGVDVIDVVKTQEDDIESVLYDYLYRGSIVVQRKSGHDLLASVQSSRLKESLARMDNAVPYRCQRTLLYTGVFSERDGYVVLDGEETRLQYMSLVMALTAWNNRGGCAVNLCGDQHILEWVKHLESQLDSYQHHSEEQVFSDVYYPPDMPDVDDVMQTPVEVTDWRRSVITFPGLGVERVNALKEYMEKSGYHELSLLNALNLAVSDSATAIPGWGSKTVDNNRRWLGMPSGYQLELKLKE